MIGETMSAADQPSRLTVQRNSKNDIGERHLVVSLDGEKVGYLLFRQSLTRDIEPGHHRLRVHNTLVWKTVEFDVARGEHVRFLACNKMSSGSFSMLLMIGVGPLSVTLERLAEHPTTK
jgi:hypothetical protein